MTLRREPDYRKSAENYLSQGNNFKLDLEIGRELFKLICMNNPQFLQMKVLATSLEKFSLYILEVTYSFSTNPLPSPHIYSSRSLLSSNKL